MDVSRGCVLTNNNEIPVAKGFEATLLWMDDSRLEVGKEYLVKLGTKKIAGVVKSIEFKTDVNTGEHRMRIRSRRMSLLFAKSVFRISCAGWV